MTNGVTLAESVSMALAEHIGKLEAHRTIGVASRRAMADHRLLADVLGTMPEVTEHLSREEIARLLTTSNYLGASEELVRAALAEHALARDARRIINE
jgi:3-carboxy-cis,cis-muconate cycloisomerase